MTLPYYYIRVPSSRIASMDVYAVGLQKHHVDALLEFDVTEIRAKLRNLRKSGLRISFNGWLIKVISEVLQKHPEAAAFLYNKRKLICFRDINISILVEKQVHQNRVPIPLVIEKTNEKSAIEISNEIESARNQDISDKSIVLAKGTSFSERLYYLLPACMRRTVWKLMLRNPQFAYKKMGNCVVTSVGMMGKINGWFIHKSVHPISFGVGSVIRKPVVLDNEIKIREMLNMTILADHDVIDGAPMVRFLNDLTTYIENGEGIQTL